MCDFLRFFFPILTDWSGQFESNENSTNSTYKEISDAGPNIAADGWAGVSNPQRPPPGS